MDQALSCSGSCGQKVKQNVGGLEYYCYCDEYCYNNGDCCSDIDTYCQPGSDDEPDDDYDGDGWFDDDDPDMEEKYGSGGQNTCAGKCGGHV